MSRCTQLFLAAHAVGNHYRDTLEVPIHDLSYEDFKQAPNEFGKAITESIGEPWEAFEDSHPSSPVDLWVRYKSDLSPWIRETSELAETMGYPAK